MYIYIYMYILSTAYTHTHTHKHARAHTHTHTHKHTHTHTHTHRLQILSAGHLLFQIVAGLTFTSAAVEQVLDQHALFFAPASKSRCQKRPNTVSKET
jgi:ABC-type nickel/cobalt efflux system permease component RcnA